MKISDIGKAPSGVQNFASGEGVRAGTQQNFAFAQHMLNYSQTQYQAYAEELREKIFSQGDIITRKADLSEFIKYRALIAELMELAAGNAFACTQSRSFDRKGRRNVFVLIKTVNERLDEMVRQILSEQSDNIRLLELVDDIKGLLVDMFL